MPSKRRSETWRDWMTRVRMHSVYRRIRLTHEMNWALKKLAAEKHTHVQELIVTYIEWGLENEVKNETEEADYSGSNS